MTQGILNGIRILDMSAHTAGQMSARLLAEAGASVIKVEPPGGDAARAKPGYIVWNRSKRSLILDLDTKDGRAELDRLLGGADVLIHDLGPAAAAQRALDDARLRERFPQLVICGVTPFPIGHPGADMRHSEPLMNARVGFLDEQMGSKRIEGPVYMRAPVATMSTWYLGAAGVVARLIARDRDGVAGVAHTSLLQGYLVSMGTLWSRAEKPDEAFARSLTKNNRAAAGSGVPRYRCADDKWMYVMGPPEILPLTQAILKELGVELPSDTAKQRPTEAGWPGVGEDNRIKVYAQRNREDWLKEMWANDIPAAPCLKIGELFFDAQAIANEYVIEVDDPRFGKTRQPGKPFVTSPPQTIYGAAPEPGQHTHEVLAEDWTPRFKATGCMPTSKPPLAGCKVLDFGQFLASPTGPMLMAHLGAEVIKIEPTTGDGMRATPLRPWTPGRSYGQVNRGKRSIAIDLKDASTRPLLESMVKWADVFHHNVRYDAAQRLDLDDASLRALNPRLIYCHTSSYGHTGERAGWPGFDPLMQGFAGWSVEGAGEGNPPIWHRTGFIDFQCGLNSLVATLLALYHRGRTGNGQFCTASLLGGAMQSMSEAFLLPDGKVSPVAQLDANQTGISPFDRIYQCNDRYWVAVLAETETEQRSLMEAFGAKNTDELEACIGRYAQDHALYKLARANVPAEAVRLRGTEAFYESHINQEIGLVVRNEHAVFGKLDQPGKYWNMGETGLSLGPAPPALGEHSREICKQFGIPDTVLEEWEAAGQLLSMKKQ